MGEEGVIHAVQHTVLTAISVYRGSTDGPAAGVLEELKKVPHTLSATRNPRTLSVGFQVRLGRS